MIEPNEATLAFISVHRNTDVREVALHARGVEGVDVRFALEQIAGWQKARVKLPSWSAISGLIFPSRLALEQCSGQGTAVYKASIVQRLYQEGHCGKGLFVDLTGGFGVDFSFIARGFSRAVYVERQETLCSIARHNFPLLGLEASEVVCNDGVEYLYRLAHADVIFLDPARRDDSGARTYAISDGSPDVLAIKDELLSRGTIVILKLSPMLDVTAVTNAFCEDVREVHVVSDGGECKEILIVMSRAWEGSAKLLCVSDGDALEVRRDVPVPSTAIPTPGNYLYEPNAAMMKAGCFGWLCEEYGVRAIAANSHLFVAMHRVEAFPGRVFVVSDVLGMSKRELHSVLHGLTKANITVRNFPLTAAELHRRLGLKDGGEVFIFATTLSNGRHVLIITHRMG